MNSSFKKYLFALFKGGANGESTTKAGILKKSTIGIAVLALVSKTHFYLTRDKEFENRVRLIFPNYNPLLENEEGKKVSIVSENQVEHMIKLCNLYGKTVKCKEDPNISAFKAVNLILDYSTFNQIKKINVNT
jgi:hypothetical protein